MAWHGHRAHGDGAGRVPWKKARLNCDPEEKNGVDLYGSKPCTPGKQQNHLQVDVRPKHDMIHLYTFWIPLLRAIQKRNEIHTVKRILQNLEHCTVHGRLSLLEEGMGEQLGADSNSIHGSVLWKALMLASLKNGAGNGVTSQKNRRICWTNTEHSH